MFPLPATSWVLGLFAYLYLTGLKIAIAQELLLVWETTEAQEWIDQFEWIPF
ncbi:hypothetical protein [Nostoc sp.]|uniref:hypothetical protein n=1 Tax=Nostoc sp. TaxID=1180 RepID=UPI002FF82224